MMMGSKVVFIVLVAFIALPALAEVNPTINGGTKKKLDGSFDIVVEIAEQLLVSLTALASEIIDQMAYVLQETIVIMDIIAQRSIEAADGVIELAVGGLHLVIEEIKNSTANNTNPALLNCIEDNEKQIILLQEKAANSSAICIVAATEKIVNDTLALVADLKDLEEDLHTEELNLEKCKSETIPFNCIKDVISVLVDLAESFPERAQPDADKTKQDYDLLGTTIQKCVSDASTIAEDEAAQVYHNILQCANLTSTLTQ